MKDIKKIYIDEFGDIGDFMIDEIFSEGAECVEFVGRTSSVEEAFKTIMYQAYDYEFKIECLDFDMGYDSHVLMLDKNGLICIYPTYASNKKMRILVNDVVYIERKYYDDYLATNDGNDNVYVVCDDDEDEEACDKDSCTTSMVLKDEDGKSYGMEYSFCDGSKQYTVSYVSTTPVELEELNDKINKMIEGIKR